MIDKIVGLLLATIALIICGMFFYLAFLASLAGL